MTARIGRPRHGSVVCRALESLHANGGKGMLNEWMNAGKWSGTIVRFEMDIVATLLRQQLVIQRGSIFEISDDGLEFLGVPVDAPACVPLPVAGPRFTVDRPLRTSNQLHVRIMREGAFDYRDIPSLQGQERIAFRSSLKIEGGDAK